MRTKKATSVARTQANRANALRSTGPKSNEGKATVKWNAMKHGLLAREVVIDTGDGKENAEEFRSLLASLVSDLSPEGTLEEMLVEKIAVCYWRLRRALKCEAGGIRKMLNTYVIDQEFDRSNEVRQILDMPSFTGKGKQRIFLMSSAGIRHLIERVEGLLHEVETEGRLSKVTSKGVQDIFGGDEGTFGRDLLFYEWLASDEGQETVRADPGEGETLTSDECRRVLMKMLVEKLSSLKNALKATEEQEDLNSRTEMAQLSIPDDPSAARILRYETTIERQMYRAMSEFERLQRQRQGEYTPPPIKVELSESG